MSWPLSAGWWARAGALVATQAAVVTALMWGGAMAQVSPSSPPDEAVQRERIAREREAAERLHAQRVEACQRRFAVTSCLDEARVERRQVVDSLRRQEEVLDGNERRRRAAQRLAEIQQKTEAQARLTPPASTRPDAAAADAAPAPAPAAAPATDPPKVGAEGALPAAASPPAASARRTDSAPRRAKPGSDERADAERQRAARSAAAEAAAQRAASSRKRSVDAQRRAAARAAAPEPVKRAAPLPARPDIPASGPAR